MKSCKGTRIRIVILILLLSVMPSAQALVIQTIKSAVSPEFPDGLHTAYIRYIAAQLNTQTDIALIPYARRLRELNRGGIDMMVGVSNSAPIGDHVVRIDPPYESLSIAIFTRTDYPDKIDTMAALTKLSIAVTRSSSRQTILSQFDEHLIVEANDIEQKIDLLLKRRVDVFLHVKQSSLLKLEDLGLQDEIRLIDFQPPKDYEQHIAISRFSWLWDYRHQIENVIKRGITNGDFALIRRQYYARGFINQQQ